MQENYANDTRRDSMSACSGFWQEFANTQMNMVSSLMYLQSVSPCVALVFH